MAKGKGGGQQPAKSISTRQNGKTEKQRPKTFDPVKRRLVTKTA